MDACSDGTGGGDSDDDGDGSNRGEGHRSADLWSRPGYLVRRLHQIHLGLFLEEGGQFDITPIQFAVLTILNDGGWYDQVTLSRAVGVDRTSAAGVIKRLERRGLLLRQASVSDRRARSVRITESGTALTAALQPSVDRAQLRLVEPLSESDRVSFSAMLQQIIRANNSASRAPVACKTGWTAR